MSKTARMIGSLMVGLVKVSSHLLNYTGAYALMRYINRNKTIILMYHGISSRDITDLENFDGKHVNRLLFEKQIMYLKKHYNIISIDDYVDSRKKGKKTPERSVILTFDDGYRDNFTVLYPLIKKHSIPGMIYLTVNHIGMKSMIWQNAVVFCIANTLKNSLRLDVSGNVQNYDLSDERARLSSLIRIKALLRGMDEKKREMIVRKIIEACDVDLRQKDDELHFMSWPEIGLMKKDCSLVSFGSHTLSHPALANLTADEVKKELVDSRKEIERKIGKINHFSYPYGSYNSMVADITKSSGYSSAVTVEHGYNTGKTDLFRLKRIPVSNKNDMALFRLSLFFDLGKHAEFFAKMYVRLKNI